MPEREAARTVWTRDRVEVAAVATSSPALAGDAPHVRVSAPGHAPGALAETVGPVTLIGSRRDCQLPIPHADVSQVHCALCNNGRHVLVCDLRSRMGTFVNGQRVVVARLKPGDELHVGSVPLRLEFLRLPLRQEIDPDPTLLSPPLKLIVGPSSVEITRQPAVIGRRNSCDVVIDTPDVSLAHALIFCLNGRPLICDLSSRSGTLLGGKRISLAWLHDGDCLTIGGESLEVRWPPPDWGRRQVASTEPATAVADPPAERAQPDHDFHQGPAAVPPGAAPQESATAESPREAERAVLAALSAGGAAGGGDLSGLEQSIALLQGQLLAFRLRLEQRSSEIERRALELETHSARLAKESAELEQRRAEMETLRVQAEHSADSLRKCRRKLAVRLQAYRGLRRELADQRSGLEAARAELDEGRKLLSAQLAELTRDRAALEQAKSELARDRSALEQVLGEVSAREAACAARETELKTLATALENRQRELQARENELRERQVASQEADRRLAQLRHLIESTARVFAEMQSMEAEEAPHASRGGAPAGGRSDRLSGPAGAVGTGGADGAASPKSGIDSGRGDASDSLRKESLPAPLVREPIFAGPRGLPQEQWPPELRERLQVLRRVSKKSEEELVQQVWSEHEKRVSGQQGASAGSSRRMRSRS